MIYTLSTYLTYLCCDSNTFLQIKVIDNISNIKSKSDTPKQIERVQIR